MSMLVQSTTDKEGFPFLRDAILSLLNQFPGLDGDKVTYQALEEDYGICMVPESAPVVLSTQTDIVGGVHRVCQFSFLVMYRTDTSSEGQKHYVSTFLEEISAWVCGEPVNGYQIKKYPELTGRRTITDATRTNVYAFVENANKSQDWAVSITVKYTHDY